MLVIIPQLMVGQTVDDLVTASERLRTAVGSRQVRVIPNPAHTGASLRFLFADPLAAVVDARFPSPNLAPTVTTAEMGVTEDGRPWRIPIPVSTLTAGCSGSGKASAMWMLLLNLAPAIKSGLVQVHGIDLKGGMELGLGPPLFTRYATTPETAVVLLEDAVAAMTTRAHEARRPRKCPHADPGRTAGGGPGRRAGDAHLLPVDRARLVRPRRQSASGPCWP